MLFRLAFLACVLTLYIAALAQSAPIRHDRRVHAWADGAVNPHDRAAIALQRAKAGEAVPIEPTAPPAFDDGVRIEENELIGDVPIEVVARDAFVRFVRDFSKTYEASEVKSRFDIFTENLAFIRAHNAKAHLGLVTYTVGVNRFADMSNEEFASKVLKAKSSPRDASKSIDQAAKEVNALPTSVDWRTKGVVTGVKDQGQCGSCWAFSSVGSMEGAHALATGNLVSLSEQLLVDCANNGADTCDEGGEMSDGYIYVINAGGAMSEADYPYTATSGNTCAFNKSEVVATFSSWQAVESGNETALAVAAAARPTVSVAIDASSLSFQLYQSGVYSNPDCQKDNADLDHAVLVVGYDTDATSKSNYWIVKNSWGESWGNNGYIWMLKDGTGNLANNCGIATDAMFILA